MTWLFWERGRLRNRARIGGEVTWFSAREVAMAMLGVGPDEIMWAASGRPPQVVLTWEGNDAGRVPGRRLVVRDHRKPRR